MNKERVFSSSRHQRQPDQADSIVLIENGLDPNDLKKMHQRLKNEGKCCEGGSEGWNG